MDQYNGVSILQDIKKSLGGISKEDTSFDQDILLQINGAFAVLNELGVGPGTGFYVDGYDKVWDDFAKDPVIQGLSRLFVLYSTRIGFDPPSSSFVLSSLQEQRKELTFRLTVEHDRIVTEDSE